MSSSSGSIMVQFEQEIEANHLNALLGFSSLIEVGLENISDHKKDFEVVVYQALNHFNIKAQSFSEKFTVHPSTVARWASGESCPQKFVRTAVLEWLYEEIENKISDCHTSQQAIIELNKKVKYEMKKRFDYQEAV